MASDKAFQDEIKAYEKVKKMLGKSATVFQAPAGADAGFPDFGFTVIVQNKTIDIHIEYKNSHTAQMGSMRDWRFNGKEFSTNDTVSEQKQELITIMNATPDAIKNGKRLLKDLKTYFHKGVKEIYSGCLSIIKDKAERRIQTENFVEGTDNYQIANIANATLGNKIIEHYKNKFKKVRVPKRADGHLLMMFIKDEIWWVDKFGKVTDKDIKNLAAIFGKTDFNKLSGLTAALEVRIQPRGLTSPNKPTSIDVMASYRLKGKPTGGTKII